MPTRRRFLQGAIAFALFAGRGVEGRAASLPLPSPRGKGDASTGAAGRPHCDQVDVFLGTGGHGHTYPGATRPFGMVQLSPDTNTVGWDACSGYHLGDASIMGFSHTHLSGTGASDMLDLLLMPATGEARIAPGPMDHPAQGYRSRYDHADEHAEPGYYTVLLKDYAVRAELSATERAGIHRYHFPAGRSGHLVLDWAHGIANGPDQPTRVSDADLRLVDDRTVLGGRRVHQWANGRHIYFALRLSRPFAGAQLYAEDRPLAGSARQARGKRLKAILRYPDAHDGPLLVKVGLSGVSAENALRNLDAEIGHWDFERVRADAADAWERELARVDVQTDSAAHRRTFYTALYHSMLAPTLFDDVDGRYRGMDGKVHRLPKGEHNYSTYSLWDTYRALHPLYTLIQPERVPPLVNGLVRMAAESPAGVPVWPLQGVETACMIGWHSAAVIAEAHAKGFTGIDYGRAWKEYRQRAFVDDYRGLKPYRKYGYVPCDKDWESASKTLEYAYCDWSSAHLARAAGDEAGYAALRARSRNYQHVFNTQSQFVQPRLANGDWANPFDPRSMGHTDKYRDFTESNAWVATFLNQHDVHQYMRLFGGPEAFAAKLDGLFTASSKLPGNAPPDISGMIGQYAHGNEPSHHIAYLYAYAGQAHKTQARVRQILTTLYHDKPDGLAGNEDCGQMSAWYLLSAMGFYPVDPVSGNYVIGSPLFDRVTLDVGQGRRLVVEANNNGPDRPYVQSVTLNGQPHTRTWLRHADLAAGGHLVFEMGPQPNPAYGADPADRPPSFV